MEILGSSLTQSVNFYIKNAGNNIGMTEKNENIFSAQGNALSENAIKNSYTTVSHPNKRKRKNKRLNTIDSDYLMDEPFDINETEVKPVNLFIEKKENAFINTIKKKVNLFFTKTPLINYFFLKRKKNTIQETVEKLNNINQNVDELINTNVPYGEESYLYTDIAENLTKAASILGKIAREKNIQ